MNDVTVHDSHANDGVKLKAEFISLASKAVATSSPTLSHMQDAVTQLWRLGQKRAKDDFCVNFINPAEQGDEPSRTWVQLVLPDMPFVIQSLLLMLRRQGYSCFQLIHPVIGVHRDNNGRLLGLSPVSEENGLSEAFIHIELERISDSQLQSLLTQDLYRVLYDVRAVTLGWQPCLEQLAALQQKLAFHQQNPSELQPMIAFLQWLADDHFVFLGYRYYQVESGVKQCTLTPMPGSGLGLLSDERLPLSQMQLAGEAASLFQQKKPLLICKATSRSVVHRDTFMDYIGIRDFDPATGGLIGEHRILGLFSASAFHCELHTIPLLREKVASLRAAAGFSLSSYNGRALKFILEDLPREILFMLDENALLNLVVGVMGLMERPDVGVFFHSDAYSHLVSVLVYIPRERFHTGVRLQLMRLLKGAYQTSEADFSVQMGDAALARVHFTLQTEQCAPQGCSEAQLKQKITTLLADWTDSLHQQLLLQFGELEGGQLYHRYAEAFTTAYRESFSATQAVLDISHIEKLSDTRFEARLYQQDDMTGAAAHQLSVRLYCIGQPAVLSDTLPILENMGVRVINERPYPITTPSGLVWLHDIELRYHLPELDDVEFVSQRFERNLEAVWFHHQENDSFNKLVLSAGLEWRQVLLFRALFFYSRQMGQWFSLEYVATVLDQNPEAVKTLWACFAHRFAFESSLVVGQGAISQAELTGDDAGLDSLLVAADSLDEERIFRRYWQLIQAMDRSNFFLHQQDVIPVLAFKFAPERLEELPLPRPAHEIFVYAADFEGIHLRAGDIARGGLRWSDRREDFRTEILDLMKAQVNKNAVIVPTGAKGGFVIKAPLEAMPQNEIRETLRQCYRRFVGALLELTDDVQPDGSIRQNPALGCYDGEDSYLVVAADKGTAALSDEANSVSAEYGFWLGDAFASGGSAGYDHKQMGITARGAWESVKHHFLELGNAVSDGVTVVGIGDMSGDVFGNGMLLSNRIQLVAAFNHLHIFLDPQPDMEKSFRERQRMFALPGSSWADYDQKLISAGGGVFSRKVKSISISQQMQQQLGIKRASLSPDQLIRALLCAPVDLLWNGGIGTYIRASTERDSDVGDRANDNVRVAATELNCRVVGEGGNLGLTQAARIEFSLAGGRINTDAIDNSAGVDCSDHEVNIKILLRLMIEQGVLKTDSRDQLLEAMTDEIAALVLQHNYQQTRAISLVVKQAKAKPVAHAWLIDQLEELTPLHRELEKLPSRQELLDRAIKNQGLARPEIAVIMAHTKSYLKQQLVQQKTFLISPLGRAAVQAYFPTALHQYSEFDWKNHPLYDAIAANCLINRMINRLGLLFPIQLLMEDFHAIEHIIKAFVHACELLDADGIWTEIDRLDGAVSADLQAQWAEEVSIAVQDGMECLLSNGLATQEGETWLPGIEAALTRLASHWNWTMTRRVFTTEDDLERLPDSLADRLLQVADWRQRLEVCRLSQLIHHDVLTVAEAYTAIEHVLGIDALREMLRSIQVSDRWQWLARRTLLRDLYSRHSDLTRQALATGHASMDGNERVNAWRETVAMHLERYQSLMRSTQADEQAGLNAVTVLLNAMGVLVLR